MDPGRADMSRSSSVGPSRSNASTNTNSRSSTPLDRDSVEHTLLHSVVRSRRTPIACTECRRRQVKCSGGTPRCERCEKRGMHCEYIPLHQHRASLASASIVVPRPQSRGMWSRAVDQSHARGPIQPSGLHWQQSSHGYPAYGFPSSPGYHDSLQNPLVASSQSPSTGHYIPPASQSAPAYGYGSTSYEQAFIPATPEASLGMPSAYVRQMSPSQLQYPDAGPYTTYGQTDANTVVPASLDPGYDHTAYQPQRRFSAPVAMQPSISSYPEQYFTGSSELYEASAGAPGPSGSTHTGWVDPNDQAYHSSGYQDPNYH